MESTDRFALARELKIIGNTPLSIKEKTNSISDFLDHFEDMFSGVSTSELIILTRNMSGMLKAGLSLSRALSVLEKQTKNKVLNKILISVSEEINAGGTLSSGLAKFPKVFSKLFVSMARAGEESGNLVGALTEVGDNLYKAHSLTKKIKGALMYPGVILSAMVLIGIMMFAFVVPTLAKTFNELGVQLPASTRLIISLGNFFSEYLILSLLMVAVLIVGVIYVFRAKFFAKYVDFLIVRLPLIGTMAKELNTARTARTLSSLLLSGVSITRAIEITKDVVQNIYYKEVLDQAILTIEKGKPLSTLFETRPDLYPVMMSEMIQVGEETGKLSEMLLQIALFYEEEISNKTKNLSTIIEPVLMVIIGAGVGFFALSMVTPLYSILDSIS